VQQCFAAKIKLVMFCYFRSCVLLQVHAQLAVSELQNCAKEHGRILFLAGVSLVCAQLGISAHTQHCLTGQSPAANKYYKLLVVEATTK